MISTLGSRSGISGLYRHWTLQFLRDLSAFGPRVFFLCSCLVRFCWSFCEWTPYNAERDKSGKTDLLPSSRHLVSNKYWNPVPWDALLVYLSAYHYCQRLFFFFLVSFARDWEGWRWSPSVLCLKLAQVREPELPIVRSHRWQIYVHTSASLQIIASTTCEK